MDFLEFTNYEEELIETYNEELNRFRKFQSTISNHFNYDYYKNVILKFADVYNLEVTISDYSNTVVVFCKHPTCHIKLTVDVWSIDGIEGEFYEIEKFKDELEEFESELKKFN